MQQTAKSLPETTSDEEMTYEVRAPVTKELERLKWFLWHGNVYQAFQVMQSVEGDLEVAVVTSEDATARKLLKAVEEFHTYIENNTNFQQCFGLLEVCGVKLLGEPPRWRRKKCFKLPTNSNNSPLPLIVTLTSFGCISPEFKGIRNFICVYQILALTHLTPFYQMQRPFREKKHSALGNPFSAEVSFHVSA